MAKAGVKDRASTQSARSATRQRIVQAALETLKQEGFTGASARAIGRVGGFNQALVFYYFGSVNELLLAALDETSNRRMERYQAAFDGVRTLPDLLRAASEIYREDLETGHITVLAEMIGGSSSAPDLRPEVAARMEPWISFTEAAVARVLADSPLEQLVPSRDLAFTIVALYLGIEMLTHLDGDRSRAESLFATGTRLAAPLGGLLGGSGGR